jgi:Family of unknown function (DUF5995)
MRWTIPAAIACTLLLALPAVAAAEDPPFLDWTSLLPGLTTEYQPNSENICNSGKPKCVAATLSEMEKRLKPLRTSCDHNAVFALLYKDVTAEYKATIDADPYYFSDNNFVNHEDAVFASYYFRAYDDYKAGHWSQVPGAWQIALDAARDKVTTGAGDLFLGVNAHINRDLPYVLYGIGLVKPDGSSRKPDHDKVNQILNAAYNPAIADAAAHLDPTIDDSDVPGTKYDDMTLFQAIAAWREIAWRNAERLASAPDAATRAAVAQSIEDFATTQAQLIRASMSYVPIVQSSASRDAYCALHHG